MKDTIDMHRLVYFQSGCAEHQRILKRYKDFNFVENIEMIHKFLEEAEFSGGLLADKEDFKIYVACNEIFVGIDVVNDDLDEDKYLFGAFNVYHTQGNHSYSIYQYLTGLWRSHMKNTYTGSDYYDKVRYLIEAERLEKIKEINEEYNNQIESLQ